MWLMSGVFFKNAVDDNGNKLPAGRTRRDPWVVVQPVADAVAALERLHDQELLFPTSIETHRQLKNTQRKGQARRAQRCADDLATFIEWVNSVGEQRGATGRTGAMDQRNGPRPRRFHGTPDPPAGAAPLPKSGAAPFEPRSAPDASTPTRTSGDAAPPARSPGNSARDPAFAAPWTSGRTAFSTETMARSEPT